jgi:hypothetical protein
MITARERTTRVALTLAAVGAATLLTAAQQQTGNRPSAWPCGARLDLSYFRVAEGSGGHLLLLAPAEIGESANLLIALGAHPQTVFRTAGTMQPGVHEIAIPIDSTIDSLLFSAGMQCLQTAQVIRPSGQVPVGDDVTEFLNFNAEHLTVVRQPEPGVWTLRVAGSGISGIVVQARSTLGITQLDFAPSPGTTFTPIPRAGVENIVRIRMSGQASNLGAFLVNGAFERMEDIALAAGNEPGTFVGRLNAVSAAFRVGVTGIDEHGHAFQRMSAPLLTPTR